MRQAMILALVLLTFACGRSRTQDLVPVASAAAPAPVTSSISDAAAPRSASYSHSVATFREDILDECVDIRLETTAALKADAGNPAAAIFAKNERETSIRRPCNEEFSDRTVLAICTVNKTVSTDGGTPIGIHVVSAYYDYGTVGTTDVYRKQCLKAGGEWNGAKRDSDEWNRARLEYDMRGARKMLKAAQE